MIHQSITTRTMAAVALSLLTQAVCADSSSENMLMDHWYIGGGLGQSFLKPEANSVALTLSEDSDLAYRIFAGYRFDNNWSAELFWADLGQAEFSSTTSGNTLGIVEYQSFGIGGLYQLPIAQDWDVFATAGVGRLRNSFQPANADRIEDSFVYAGAGVMWNMAKTWDLRAEYDYYDTDAQALTVNIVKRFGSATPRRIQKLEEQVAQQELVIADAREQIAAQETQLAQARQDPGMHAAAGTAVAAAAAGSHDNLSCDDLSVSLEGVRFARGSVELNAASRDKLDQVIKRLLGMPADIRFEIRGHTDDVGSELYNYSLSLTRARSVRDYMAYNGINIERIDAHGYGEWRPAADNSSVDGKNLNRRAELVLLYADKYKTVAGDCPGHAVQR